MSIGLSNSTLGTEQSNIEELIRNIDNNLINECIRVTEKDLNELVDSVDTMWIGITADEFKKKVLNDQEKFINILHDVAERMHQDIAQMSSNISNADSYIAANMGIAPMSGDSDLEPTSHYTPMDYYDVDHPKEHYTPKDYNNLMEVNGVMPTSHYSPKDYYDLDHPKEHYTPMDYYDLDHPKEHYTPMDYDKEREFLSEINAFQNQFKYGYNPPIPLMNGIVENKDIVNILNDNNNEDNGFNPIEYFFWASGTSFVNFVSSGIEGFAEVGEHIMDFCLAVNYNYGTSIGSHKYLNPMPKELYGLAAARAISTNYVSDCYDSFYGDPDDENAFRNNSYGFDYIHGVGHFLGGAGGKYVGSALLQSIGFPSVAADSIIGGVDAYGKYVAKNLQSSNCTLDEAMNASVAPAIIDAAASGTASVISKSIDAHLIDESEHITLTSLGNYALDKGQKGIIGYAAGEAEDDFVLHNKNQSAIDYNIDSRYKNTNAINVYEDKRFQSPTDKS